MATRSHRGGHWFDPSIAHPAQRPVPDHGTGGAVHRRRDCCVLQLTPVHSGSSWDDYGPSSAALTVGSLRPVIHRVIWVLELRPSLLRMLVIWVSTVRSDRNRVAAIWRLLRSSATRRAISVSRRVRTVRGSVLTAVGGLGRGRLPLVANAIPSLIVIARPWAKAVSKARWPMPRTAAVTA